MPVKGRRCDIINNCIPAFNPTRLMKFHSIVTL